MTTPSPNLTVVRDILQGVPFFKELAQPELDLIVALGHVVAYPKDMVLFKEGDKGEALYVVIDGAVRITKRSLGQSEGIIAYIEPVSAPVYALVLLGQEPSVWTIAGGALIVAAGVLVVLYARGEPALEPLG